MRVMFLMMAVVGAEELEEESPLENEEEPVIHFVSARTAFSSALLLRIILAVVSFVANKTILVVSSCLYVPITLNDTNKTVQLFPKRLMTL